MDSTRLSFEHLRGQAKQLLAEWRNNDTSRIEPYFKSADAPSLARSQLVVAREFGFHSWKSLKKEVLTTEFFRALRDGERDRAKKLLEEHTWLAKSKDSEGRSPLHMAAEFNDDRLIEILAAYPVDIEATYGQSAHTALSWALTVNADEAAVMLLKSGAKIDLFCSAGLGLLDVVQQFWPNGTLIPKPSQTGSSRFSESGERLPRPPVDEKEVISDALYMASRRGRKDVTKFLLEKGADPNFRAYIGGTSLHWAEYSGVQEVADILRDAGGDDSLLDTEFGATPRAFGVIVPAGFGLSWILRARLQREPEIVNIRCKWGTALNAAVYNDKAECVKVLLEFGADPTLKNLHGLNAKQLAIEKGFKEIADLLPN